MFVKSAAYQKIAARPAAGRTGLRVRSRSRRPPRCCSRAPCSRRARWPRWRARPAAVRAGGRQRSCSSRSACPTCSASRRRPRTRFGTRGRHGHQRRGGCGRGGHEARVHARDVRSSSRSRRSRRCSRSRDELLEDAPRPELPQRPANLFVKIEEERQLLRGAGTNELVGVFNRPRRGEHLHEARGGRQRGGAREGDREHGRFQYSSSRTPWCYIPATGLQPGCSGTGRAAPSASSTGVGLSPGRTEDAGASRGSSARALEHPGRAVHGRRRARPWSATSARPRNLAQRGVSVEATSSHSDCSSKISQC